MKQRKFYVEAPLRLRLEEMKRLSEAHSVRILSAALGVSRGTFYNDILRAKGGNAWFNIRRCELTPKVREAFDGNYAEFSGNAAGCPAGSGALQGGPAVLGRVAA